MLSHSIQGEITYPQAASWRLPRRAEPIRNSASPVKLMVMDGSGSSLIYDMAETAEVRVGHLVDGAPDVDVYVNAAKFAPLDGLMFKEIRGLDLAADKLWHWYLRNGNNVLNIYRCRWSSCICGYGLQHLCGRDRNTAESRALVVPENRRPVATSAVLNITYRCC